MFQEQNRKGKPALTTEFPNNMLVCLIERINTGWNWVCNFNKQITQVGKQLLSIVSFQSSETKMNFKLAILMIETKKW